MSNKQTVSVSLIGTQREGDEPRTSSLLLKDDGAFEVIGVLPHCYKFKPATPADVAKIVNHVEPRAAIDSYQPALERLLASYEESAGTDRKGAIRDLMTELIHACEALGLDPEERFHAAQEVAEEHNS